jgi:hypothetical protein
MSKYELFANDCQRFAFFLMAKIVDEQNFCLQRQVRMEKHRQFWQELFKGNYDKDLLLAEVEYQLKK